MPIFYGHTQFYLLTSYVLSDLKLKIISRRLLSCYTVHNKTTLVKSTSGRNLRTNKQVPVISRVRQINIVNCRKIMMYNCWVFNRVIV